MKTTITILLALTIYQSAKATELPDEINCYYNKSTLRMIFEGITNRIRIGNRSGYYTSAFHVNFKKIFQNGSDGYQLKMIGEMAVCAKNEQCAGPYLIHSKDLYITNHNDNQIYLENNGSIALIDFNSGDCKVKIVDPTLKRRLSKFKGKISN